MTTFSVTAPAMNYHVLSPMLIVVAVATLGVAVEALCPRRARYAVQYALAGLGLVAALVAAGSLLGTTAVTAAQSVRVTPTVALLQLVLVIVAGCCLALIGERRQQLSWAFTGQAAAVPNSPDSAAADRAGAIHTEVVPLTMFSLAGMMLFPAANDLLTLFVALEVFSLPLYVLCGLARYQRVLSQESAMKYFLLGAFSSAFLVFGIAFCYGFAGSISYDVISFELIHGQDNLMLALIGLGLVSVGLLFKVGAVPFHAWVPDVYQGAPFPITAFMASATKIAAFGGLLQLAQIVVPAVPQWRTLIAAVAIVTMIFGAVASVVQTDIKRLLSYSSVTHAGFVLIAIASVSPRATVFYLAAYGFSAVGAFGLAALVRQGSREDYRLDAWRGIGRRHPGFGVGMAFLLLAAAGLPFTSGFIAKLMVFRDAWLTGQSTLVFAGVLASALAAYAYLKVIAVMFDSPADSTAPVANGVAPMGISALSRIALATCLALTFALGCFPQPVLDLLPGS